MRLRTGGAFFAKFPGYGIQAADQQADDCRKCVNADTLGFRRGLCGYQGGGLEHALAQIVYALS